MKKLTSQDRKVLEEWTPDFLWLGVHNELEHQLKLCIRGVEDAVVIGPRGVGKTKSVQRFCERIRNHEADAMLQDPAYLPREVVFYTASRATGKKTALLDLYEQLFGDGSKVGARFQSPAHLRDHIATEIKRRNIRLICIDEAQLVDQPNLDLLRQVPDAVRDNEKHDMGLVLIGNEELRDALVAIKQMGQRFSGEVKFNRLSRKSVGKYLPEFHPHLPQIKDSLSAGDWKKLETDLFRKVNGSMRRLVRVLLNANHLTLKLDRWLDEEVLRIAMDKIAGEE